MTTQQAILTAEEFLERYSDKEGHFELVKGEVIEMASPGEIHSSIATELAVHLSPYARQHNLGRVFVELGFCLECRPDTVRAPDVSFVKAEHLPDQLRRGFFPGAPDLAIEVVSPSNRATDLESKIQEYLAHGTQRVWVFYPETQTIIIHRPDGTARRYTAEDVLVDEEILPGFSLPVKELFS